jgi:hypothetical protein
MAERQRQQLVEGHWPEGDVGRSEELAQAAVSYWHHGEATPPPTWPWSEEDWKPGQHRGLVKAGALYLAAADAADAEDLGGVGSLYRGSAEAVRQDLQRVIDAEREEAGRG